MDKGEFAVSERPDFLSVRSRDKRVILGLKLFEGLSCVIHIETYDHHPFSVFLYPPGYRTIGGGRFHELKSHFTHPIPLEMPIRPFGTVSRTHHHPRS